MEIWKIGRLTSLSKAKWSKFGPRLHGYAGKTSRPKQPQNPPAYFTPRPMALEHSLRLRVAYGLPLFSDIFSKAWSHPCH